MLRLEKLPMELLILLIERRGELVSREEIVERLWGKDVFLDVDNGINTAIRKVRTVLRDDPEKPRFIETVVGKGYRFAATVVSNNGHSNRQVPTVPSIPPAASVPHVLCKEERVVSVRVRVLLGVVGVLVLFTVAWILIRRGGANGTNQPAIGSLAVLPLKNLSGDPGQEYFADGMTEAVIGRLSLIRGLRVISRTSVMRFKDAHMSVPEIAKSLGVEAIVEGSVIREGSRVRVHAQLIRALTDEHFWSETYDRELRDVLALQNDVAQSIAEKVEVTVTGKERARLASSRPVDPEAQDDYFRALHSRNKWEASYTSVQDLLTAIRYFRQAVEKDSNYGLAYAGMAYTYIDLGNPQGGNYPPKETLPLAEAAATRAVEVDPLLGEAHFALAQTLELYEWNWSEAERQYKLALELSPNYAPAHLEYGRFLQALGRNDEAMKQMVNAVELNPMDLQTRFVVAIVTYAARQYDSAILQLKELDTSYPGLGDFGLGWCYREKKMYPEAIAALQRALVQTTRGPLPLATLASAYGLAGRKHEAVKLIDELKERSQQHYISASLFAEAYIGLGEKATAMAWLERAYEERDQWMVYINAYPGWDSLRSEPRFQALVRRMNFPQ